MNVEPAGLVLMAVILLAVGLWMLREDRFR